MRRTLNETERKRIATLAPVFAPLAIDAIERMQNLCESRGYHVRVTDCLRPTERQAELWAKGRQLSSTGDWTIVDPGKVVTRARPGTSPHEYGLAMDVLICDDIHVRAMPDDSPAWREWRDCVAAAGLVSGCDFKRLRDCPHAEMPRWMDHGPR